MPRRIELNTLAEFNALNSRIESGLHIPNEVFTHYAEPILYHNKYAMFITDEAYPFLTQYEKRLVIDGFMEIE